MKKLCVLMLLLFSLNAHAATFPLPTQVFSISGSGATTNSTPVPSVLVAGYTWVSVQLTGTWTGTVTWEASNDNSNWASIALINTTSTGGGAATTATGNGTYHGPKGAFLYFRARFSTASSGTVSAVATFSPTPSSWQAGLGGGGEVSSVDVSGGTTGLTFSGGPITTSGTITMGGAPTVAGKLATYNSISTVSNGVPSELATVDLTAQTAAITATTIYAVPASGAGMYRISYVAKVTTAASVASVLGGTNGFQVKYTDPDSVVVTTAASTTSNLNTTQAQINGAIVVYAKASTNIQYLMDYTSVNATEMAFNLHIKVEAL